MRTLFEDSLAFGGLEMIRRILGLAHVEDLESVADPTRRAVCERRALRLGRALVLGARSLSDVGDVIEAARETGGALSRAERGRRPPRAS